MGTVKTGPVKSAPDFLNDAELTALTLASGGVSEAVTKITDKIGAKLDVSKPCPQAVLRFRLLIDRMTDLLGKAGKFLDERLRKFHDAGGTFALGKIAVTFPSKPRRNPKWKEQAVDLARQLADLKGEPFDADAFVKQITEATEPSISHSVELTESV